MNLNYNFVKDDIDMEREFDVIIPIAMNDVIALKNILPYIFKTFQNNKKMKTFTSSLFFNLLLNYKYCFMML